MNLAGMLGAQMPKFKPADRDVYFMRWCHSGQSYLPPEIEASESCPMNKGNRGTAPECRGLQVEFNLMDKQDIRCLEALGLYFVGAMVVIAVVGAGVVLWNWYILLIVGG